MDGAVARVVVLSSIVFSGNCTLAQIAPDSTLGAESSVVTPTNIDGLPTERIDGGATRGGNLFHSFEKFSIPTGGAAYFNNALDIQNIISRVTGSSISNIDGLIRANGTANLFLLNPNGIIFGPNARLDIGGSFLGSTASSINFADGTQFTTTGSQTTPLLTVSVPLGLQYGSNSGGIQVQQSFLQVQSGQTLALIGGDVSVEGGESGFLEALGGLIELGGLTGAGIVEIEGQQSDREFGLTSLRFPDSVERADVSLTNLAYVDVAASGGGSIAINARSIDISGESILRGGLETDSGFLEATAGDITLNATGAITIANSDIFNNVRTGAVGNAGDVNITTGSLSVTDGAQLSASTRGQGDAGSVTINARDTVSFDGEGRDGFSSAAFSRVNEGAVGKGGGINITAGSLYVTNGAQLAASTFGQGDAGSVSVQADGNVSFANGHISSDNYGQGDAGSVSVQANGDVSFIDSYISSSTERQGNAGSVSVQANSDVSFLNSYISSASSIYSYTSGQGDAGSVSVQANSDVSFASSNIYSYTYGQGDAGSVSVQANSDVSFASSNIYSGTYFGQGKGGDINIQARSVSVTDGAQLLATTKNGSGNAGSIQVNAIDSVTISGVSVGGRSSGLFTNTDDGASGQGGSITIQTGALRISDGAVLSARTRSDGDGGNIAVNANTLEVTGGGQLLTTAYGSGRAGNITVNATDSVTISGSEPTFADRTFLYEPIAEYINDDGSTHTTFEPVILDNDSPASGLFARVQGKQAVNAGNIEVTAGLIRLDNQGIITSETTLGEGGNITLRAGDILLRHNSNITTTAGTTSAGGNGGDITIDTDLLAALEDSDITANAFEGRGGNIQISAQGLILSPDSDITASSERGIDGVVEINTPDVDPSQGLATLPAEFIEASGQLVAQGCSALGENEFIVTGRGGLPPNPSDTLSSDTVWTDLRTSTQQAETRPSSEEASQPTNSAPEQLVEAQGWVIKNKGEVVLTAQAPNNTLNIPWMPSTICHTP